jgi:hypothetical protein
VRSPHLQSNVSCQASRVDVGMVVLVPAAAAGMDAEGITRWPELVIV